MGGFGVSARIAGEQKRGSLIVSWFSVYICLTCTKSIAWLRLELQTITGDSSETEMRGVLTSHNSPFILCLLWKSRSYARNWSDVVLQPSDPCLHNHFVELAVNVDPLLVSQPNGGIFKSMNHAEMNFEVDSFNLKTWRSYYAMDTWTIAGHGLRIIVDHFSPPT